MLSEKKILSAKQQSITLWNLDAFYFWINICVLWDIKTVNLPTVSCTLHSSVGRTRLLISGFRVRAPMWALYFFFLVSMWNDSLIFMILIHLWWSVAKVVFFPRQWIYAKQNDFLEENDSLHYGQNEQV